MIFHLFELVLIFFVKSPQNTGFYKENPFKQVVSGVRAIRKAPTLLLLFINFTLVFIPADSVYEAFNQPIFTGAGLPVVMIGVLYASVAVLGFITSRTVGWFTDHFSRKTLMTVTGFLAALGLFLSAMMGESLWMIIGAFFVLRVGQAIRRPIYSQFKNDLIPSEIRATTLSLISVVLDSAFDLIVFGLLSVVALKGLTGILIASSVIALIGTITPIQWRKNKKSSIHRTA